MILAPPDFPLFVPEIANLIYTNFDLDQFL